MDAMLAAVSAGLVGRAAELAALEQALSQAAAGRPGVVLLSGEPGAGKSRVIAAALELAAGRQMRSLAGYALELGGMPAFFPLARALGPALAGRAGLAALMPVLAAAGIVSAGTPPPPRLEPQAERLRLLDALVTACALVATEDPCLLALDDLQWAEPSLWEALGYLARSLEGARLLLLIAVREEALQDSGGAAARTIAALHRQRLISHLPLRRLAVGDTEELAGRLLGGPPAPRLAAAIAERSGGNPFFIEEIVRDLQERAAVLPAGGGWDFATAEEASHPHLPATLRLTILQRLERLPAGCLPALHAAAVLGRTFAADTLAAMLTLDRDQLDALLEPAQAAGLIEPQGDGWAFVHDTLREAVYERATGTRRRLHGAAARALAAEHMADAGRLALVAHHWRQAGELERGAEAALAAAAAAAAVRDPDAALRHAREGRGLREQLATGEPSAALAAARLAHGEAALEAGEVAEAQPALRGALAQAEKLGDGPLQGRIWAKLGIAAHRREATDEAAGCFAEALRLLEPAGASPQLAEALIRSAALEGVTRGRYAIALALGERGLAMAARLGLPGLEAAAALALAGTRSRATEPQAGHELLQTAYERAMAAGDPVQAAEACALLSNGTYWSGALRESRRLAERRLALAREAGDPFALRHAHTWLAIVEVARGDWQRVRELLAAAEPGVRRLENPEPLAFLQYVRSLMEYDTGDLAAAYERICQALALFEQVGPATLLWYAGVPALICLELDRKEEAARWAAAQEERLALLPPEALPARSARALLAFVYAALGDRDRGAACERALRPHAGDFHVALVHRSLAALAALRGDRTQALADLAAAETVARREELSPNLARLLVERAEMLPAGDAGRGRDLAEAAELAQRLGMPQVAAMAARLREPEPRRGPAGLTTREIEVLRLVAQGMTNRDIAAALVVSERTVINHISHIFAKTGVENRAGATAFALRQGLA